MRGSGQVYETAPLQFPEPRANHSAPLPNPLIASDPFCPNDRDTLAFAFYKGSEKTSLFSKLLRQ